MLNFQRFLVAGFFVLTFIPLVFIEWSGRITIEDVIEKNVQNRLAGLANYKAKTVEDEIEDKMEKIKSFSREPYVINAMLDIGPAFDKDGIETAAFDKQYKKHYYTFYEYLNLGNHFDVFLINLEGDIVFTVLKEPDFGTNLMDGPYKNSGLAKTFLKVRDTNEIALSNLEPYDVSGDLHSQFIAVPIIHKREVIGVLAVQVDTHIIDSISSKYAGLGQTGESVFIKLNGETVSIMNVMRGASEPPFSITLNSYDKGAELYHMALSQTSGFIQAKDLDGDLVYARWQRIEGTNWAIIVKIDDNEIQDDFSAYRNNVIGAFIFVSLFVFVMGYLFSKLVSSPIEKIARRARQIAEGNLSTTFEKSRWYEINQLSDALSRMINKQSRSIDKLNSEVKLKQVVSEVSNTINSHLESQLKDPEVMQKIAESMSARVAALYVLDDHDFVYHSAYGVSDTETLDDRVSVTDGIYSQVVVSKKPIWINHKNNSALNIKSSLYEAKSVKTLIYPILNGQDLVAILELAWDEEETPFVEDILSQISKTFSMAIIASQQKSLVETMLEQSIKQSQELLEQKESLQEANNELMEKGVKINKTLKEVEKKSKEVAKANRYKSEFLANMSHELRTPLNSMLILAHSLAENQEGNLSPDDVEAAEVIHTSGNQLLTLINDILDLSKVESGKMELSEIEVDLVEMTSGLNRRFKRMFEERGNTLSFSLSPDLPSHVLLDDTKVNQMLTNLLSNANKFTHEGSVKVDLAVLDKDTLSIAVQDTGIGIPESKQSSIFDAFKQADGSTSRSYGGTGLGLSIVKKYAELMSGQLLLQSQEGEGSTFTLLLPLKPIEGVSSATPQPSLIAKTPPQPIQPIQRQATTEAHYVYRLEDDRSCLDKDKKTVLVVEDDPIFAKILADVVSAQGCNVLIEQDGLEAVNTIEQYELDGIVLDYMLPHLNGQEILSRVRPILEKNNIPVHIISALDLSEDQAQGAIDSTVKPVSPHELTKIVNNLINTDLAKGQILIVEDNQQAFDAICKGIGVKQEMILRAKTGQEATDILQEHRPECIILDLGLPDCYGVDLLNDLERICGGDLPQIMIYTAGEIPEQSIESIKFYTDTIITKSGIHFDELLSAVEGFVQKLPAEYRVDNLPDDTLVPGQLNVNFSPDAEPRNRRAKDKMSALAPNAVKDAFTADAMTKSVITADTMTAGATTLGVTARDAMTENKTLTSDEVSNSDALESHSDGLGRFNKSGLKLLLVDDQMINTFALAKVLRKQGVTVEIAPGGKEALHKLFEISPIDLVLMDVMMPDMDGFEATKEIRKHDAFANLPIIAVTAKAMKGDKEKCLAAGMNDYVIKPIDIDELIECINKWVQ